MEVTVALQSVEVAAPNTLNWEVTIWQRGYMELARVTAGNTSGKAPVTYVTYPMTGGVTASETSNSSIKAHAELEGL